MAGNGARGQELGVGYISLTVDSSTAANQIQTDLADAGTQGGQQGGQQAAEGFKKELGDKLKTGMKASGVAIGAAAAGGVVAGLHQAMASQDLEGTMKARLGTTDSYAKEIAEAAGGAFRQGWGESLEEVGNTTAALGQALNKLGNGEDDLEGLTVQAQALAATFDQDAIAIAQTAESMVNNGMAETMQEAFDIITVGFQTNTRNTDDLLDSFNEYGSAFKQMGLDGTDVISSMNLAMNDGAWNGDIVADALREYMIITQEMGKGASEAYAAIGMNGGDVQKALAEGGPAAKQALTDTLQALNAIEDPVVRNQTAVAIFGTKAEELQTSLYNLTGQTEITGNEMRNMDGAAEDLVNNAKGMDQVVAELGRTLNEGLGEALTPLLPQLEELANKGLEFFKFLAEHPDFTQLLLALGGAIGVITAAQWLWNAAALASPVTWVLLIIVAVIAIVVGAFMAMGASWDDIINGIVAGWNWLMGLIDWVSDALNGLPGIFSVVGIWFDLVFGTWEHKLEAIQRIINTVIDLLNGAGGLINDVFGTNIGHIGTFKMPGLATGGTVTHTGSVLVGEQGPEILRLPQGASVIPLDHPAANVGAGAGGRTVNLTVNNPVAERGSASVYKSGQMLGASFV